MRILHVLYSSLPDVTGASVRSHYIVTTQAALGLEPIAVSSPFQPPSVGVDPLGVERIDDVPYHRSFDARYDHQFMVARKRLSTRMRKLTALPAFTRRVHRIAAENHVDVIHGHSLFFCGLAAVFAARMLGVPSVYEVRSLIEDTLVREGGAREGGLLYRAYRTFDALAVRLATHVVTISDGLRHDLIGRGVAADRITVIGNGVDVVKHTPATRSGGVRAQLALPDDAFVLGYIGTLFAYESLDVAIDAVRRLAPTHPKLHLMIVGGGNARAALMTYARAAGVADRIRFVDKVAHDQIGEYYEAVDLFVLPRTRNRLTDLVTPLKPLEVMARAKPVLASDCGGHAELIVDGTNGLLFPCERDSGLSDAIAHWVTRRSDLEHLGTRAREWVAAHRSWRAAVQPSVGMYENLVTRTRLELPASRSAAIDRGSA
jgi:glycogen synthase